MSTEGGGSVLSPPPSSLRRGAPIAVLRLLGLGLLALLTLVRLRDALHFISSGVAAIRYPFELDYGEGPILSQTKLLLSGQSIYQSLDQPPYTISNYPPVFHFAAGAADVLLGNTLAAGRTISVVSSLVTALFIAALVWRAAKTQAGGLARLLAAAAGGLTFLSVSYTASWGALMRVDMLACALAFAGLLVFVSGAGHRRLAYWCVLPFLLAVYTRQSTVAAATACVVVALAAQPQLGLRLGVLLAAVGLGSFGVIHRLTGGQFYFHLVTANQNTYSWHRTVSYLLDLVARYPFELAIAMVAAYSLLGGSWSQLRAAARERRADGRTSATVNWARPVLGVYLLTAFAVSLTVGKVGSEVNYLIELMAVVCACVGVAVADAFADLADSRGLFREAIGPGISVLALPALLLWPSSGLSHRPGIEWVEIPAQSDQLEMERLLEIVRRVDGPILSEDMTLLVLAGKPVEFQPFELTQLSYQGVWDESAIIQRIEDQHFRLLVLYFDVDASASLQYWRLSPQVLAAIRDHYQRSAAIGKYRLYVPLQDSEARIQNTD